jgi:hypothetical protein
MQTELVQPAAADHRVSGEKFLLGENLRDPERRQQGSTH